jgi:hypothetical protein
MDKIVERFEPQTSQAPTDEKGQVKLQVAVDWPVSAGFKVPNSTRSSLNGQSI